MLLIFAPPHGFFSSCPDILLNKGTMMGFSFEIIANGAQVSTFSEDDRIEVLKGRLPPLFYPNKRQTGSFQQYCYLAPGVVNVGI